MNSKIEIVKQDITELSIDAIVNAANGSLTGGGGVDGAIHKKAGKELTDACREIGGCRVGEAKITNGFNLNAKFVIHTVGPVWENGVNDEINKLKKCITNSLILAKINNLKSIAFPLISTGTYKFPMPLAIKTVYETIEAFLANTNGLNKVLLVAYTDKEYKQLQRTLNYGNKN